MNPIPTPEDDKRLEEELLRLNSEDMEIYKIICNSSMNKITPENVLQLNYNGFSKKEIGNSLYKLYRNGKLQIHYNGTWFYSNNI